MVVVVLVCSCSRGSRNSNPNCLFNPLPFQVPPPPLPLLAAVQPWSRARSTIAYEQPYIICLSPLPLFNLPPSPSFFPLPPSFPRPASSIPVFYHVVFLLPISRGGR